MVGQNCDGRVFYLQFHVGYNCVVCVLILVVMLPNSFLIQWTYVFRSTL